MRNQVLFNFLIAEATPSYFGLISELPAFINDSHSKENSFSCCEVSTEANLYFRSHARWFLMAVIMFTGKCRKRNILISAIFDVADR